MQNIILSINVVLPLFLTMSLGYLIKKLNMLDETTLKTMNSITFKIFLPTLLFYNIYKTDLQTSLNFKLMGFSAICVLVLFLLLCALIPLIEKENKKRGVLIQAIFRSNFVIFGITVTESLFGQSSAGVTSMVIAIVVPLFNVLSVIALEIFKDSKINFNKIIKGILYNPLIIAFLLALIFLMLDIKMPTPFEKTISDISKMATPLGLMLLGATFEFSASKSHFKQLIIGILGKLIIAPLIIIPLAVIVGFRDVELVCILVAFASPTAVSSFNMAQEMKADSELAGQLVVFTSGFSVLTVFLWILILKQLLLI